jgi:large subunit ribosomal protein L6|tara:strand:- start:179 stop:733 length:555 start_codon:yes stop_codon:yes gene_type:complete
MSKVGKKELKIPPNVKVNIIENLIEISSKLGKVSHEVNSKFCLELTKTSQIKIKPQIGNNSYLNKEIKSLWGTEHRLLKNHLEGLSKGYRLALNLKGVGFKASINENNKLLLKLGYSHDIIYDIPSDIVIKCPKQNQIIIFGINKINITTIAAKLRKLKKLDPYKGKGILFENETIVLKEGKKK